MNSQQAWQAAIGQLQMDMPKASYDTWVRDTQVVDCNEGMFTIGVQNAYARDWLDSRLTSTVSRLLTGLLGFPQNVRFVVYHHEDEESEADFAAHPGKRRE